MTNLNGNNGICNESFNEEFTMNYIMSCDIGTSTMRCIIYDKKAVQIGSAHDKVYFILYYCFKKLINKQ